MAISYDAPETLRAFAESRGITFPMLSDPGSAIIKRYGLLNTTMDPANRFYGVPFPGTFRVDPQGVVTARYFENAYQERNTVASILVREGVTPFGPARTIDTAHLTVTAAISDDEVAPGKRLTMQFDVTPRRGMHLYAPGKHSYQVISVALRHEPWLEAHDLRYPPSEIYYFAPLDERVEVYMKPFQLTEDVTVLATPEAQKLLADKKELTIAGALEYQACDEKLCYAPQRVPFEWTLPLSQLDRKPPGGGR